MQEKDENAWISKLSIISVIVIVASLAFTSITSSSKMTTGICIHTAEGCKNIIKRGAKLPVIYKEEFSNLEDFQKAVRIGLYKGDSKLVEKNSLLANLDLPITPLPAGQSKLEVEVSINELKIVQVFTNDLVSGTQQSFDVGILR